MPNRTAPKVGERLEKTAIVVAKAAEQAGSRTRTFVISDESTDRHGDIITAAGWNFANYQKNPVVLWQHMSRELPIGRVDRLATEGTTTKADVTFATADQNPFADSVFKLIEGGFLNACSVGFQPLADPVPLFDADQYLTGFKFLAQELVELSVVNVPALASALVAAKSLGIGDADLSRIFVKPTTQEDTGALALLEHRRRQLQILGIAP